MGTRRHGPPPGLQITRSIEETAAIQEYVRGRDRFSWIDSPVVTTATTAQSINPTRCGQCRHWLGEQSKKYGSCEVCGERINGEQA